MALITVASGRIRALFAKVEATAGTAAYPTASDYVAFGGGATVRRAAEFIDDPLREPTWARRQRLFAGYNAGELTLTDVYLAPISAGTVPRVGPLLRGLLGKETVNTGSNVTYSSHSVDTALPTLTVAVRIGNTVYWTFGSVVNRGAFELQPRTLARGEFTLLFQCMAWGAPTTVKTAKTAGSYTTLDVDDPDNYQVGARILIDAPAGVLASNDNSGAGYEITAISGNTLTLSPGYTVNTGQTLNVGTPVRPFLPTGTLAGDLIQWRLGGVREKLLPGGTLADIPVVGGRIEINNNVEYLWEWATGLDSVSKTYPRVYARGVREVTGRLDVYVGQAGQNFKYFKDAELSRSWEIHATAGDTAGKKVRFVLGSTIADPPEAPNQDGSLILTRNFRAVAPTLDDDIQIIFE